MECGSSSNPSSNHAGWAWMKEKKFDSIHQSIPPLHDGNMPIHVACMEGNMEIVKWLKQQGCTMRELANTELAFTPLMSEIVSNKLF
jgi:hypothetical protein